MIRRLLYPKILLPSLAAGLTVAVIDIFFEISLAALLFSGPLEAYLSSGIGLLLFGAFLFTLLIGLTSSLPGMIGIPQDTSLAILALATGSIAAATSAGTTEPLFRPDATVIVTVLAAIILTTLLTGVFFLALGYLHLSKFVRYIPYPVIGGFLAGTGWLIFQGAMSVLLGAPLRLSQSAGLIQKDTLVLWLPALVFAVSLLLIQRRKPHWLVLPVVVLVSVGIFYAALLFAHIPLSEAQANGWLLGPFSEEALWQPFPLSAISQVEWSAIFDQSLQIGSVLIVSVLGLLFNVSGLELTLRQEIDLDQELRSAGIANLVGGLGGSPVGYQALSFSKLVRQFGSQSRIAALSTSAFIGLTLIFGASLLGYFPKFILGGLLMYIGLSFLVEWVVDAWFSLPRADYAIVLVILGIIGAFGFLQGLAAGTGIALVLFVVNYSRIHIVRHSVTGEHYRSTIDRPVLQRQYLRQHGQQSLILELQGYIFFGTAYGLVGQIKQRARDSQLPALRFVVLDFRYVTGFDSSAIFVFQRLHQMATAEGFQMIFTCLPANRQDQLSKAGLSSTPGGAVMYLKTLDHGMEHYENTMLAEAGLGKGELLPCFQDQLAEIFTSSGEVARIMKYLQRVEIDTGQVLIHQGDPSDCLYFIETGMVSIEIALKDGGQMRIRTAQCGTVIGEIGLYLGKARTASVVAMEPCTLNRLSIQAFEVMQREEPELAATFHKWVATILAERLAEDVKSLLVLLQ